MSSATSTSQAVPRQDVLPPKGGAPAEDGFRIPHFFVLLSLVAATVAVMLARPSAPENLILISLTIGAAGLAAIACYRTIAPLLDKRAEEDREPLSARLRADLEREKALTLRSIKELEFDRAMGKLSQQDFDQMAGRLRARAMGIMQQLEAGASVYRQEIERELATRIGGTPAVAREGSPERTLRPTSDVHDGLTSDVNDGLTREASEGRRRPDLQVRQCACGTTNDADAKFCKSCGAKLAETHA